MGLFDGWETRKTKNEVAKKVRGQGAEQIAKRKLRTARNKEFLRRSGLERMPGAKAGQRVGDKIEKERTKSELRAIAKASKEARRA